MLLTCGITTTKQTAIVLSMNKGTMVTVSVVTRYFCRQQMSPRLLVPTTRTLLECYKKKTTSGQKFQNKIRTLYTKFLGVNYEKVK